MRTMILIFISSILLSQWLSALHAVCAFSIREATISDIQSAFHRNQVTSEQLTEFYISEIKRLNPLLKGVIEVNPDAVRQAKKADEERTARIKPGPMLGGLHGIPILLKDNIATKDKLNTTAGSLALVGSVVPRDAGVVEKLRKAGVVILGKASLSEWAHFRSFSAPNGWCARNGQGKNPYVLSEDPCRSSSGSAISVAANMATVSLGTETDGSILCPSSFNAVVGIKPTLGLTSRAGVIPISPRQDTVGPMCRTVSDAVYVLDAITGFDERDARATKKASKYIPQGGYLQFLKPDGLKGKRVGIVRNPFFSPADESVAKAFEDHLQTLRQKGAILVDNLEIANISSIYSGGPPGGPGGEELAALEAEFKIALNAYLDELVSSRVRSLADVIAFNKKFSDQEKIKQYGQDIFLLAEATKGIGKPIKEARKELAKLSKNGFVRLVKDNKLHAVMAVGSDISTVLAIGGFPGISVPAAYNSKGVPVGTCFCGLKGSEPHLIEIAYGFEQATKIRKPPKFLP